MSEHTVFHDGVAMVPLAILEACQAQRDAANVAWRGVSDTAKQYLAERDEARRIARELLNIHAIFQLSEEDAAAVDSWGETP